MAQINDQVTVTAEAKLAWVTKGGSHFLKNVSDIALVDVAEPVRDTLRYTVYDFLLNLDETDAALSEALDAVWILIEQLLLVEWDYSDDIEDNAAALHNHLVANYPGTVSALGDLA